VKNPNQFGVKTKTSKKYLLSSGQMLMQLKQMYARVANQKAEYLPSHYGKDING